MGKINLQVLQLKNKNDCNKLLKKFNVNDTDVYFLPEYLSLYQLGTKEGKAKCLVLTDRDKILFYPYIERKIPDCLTDGHEFMDITSAYGYGGVISTSRLPDFISQANTVVNDFFREIGYISEFVRFHPVLNNYKLRECTRVFVHNTFGIRFTDNSVKDFRFWKGSFRRGVKKAIKLGLQFHIEPLSKDNLLKFVEIYENTMRRKHADAYYFFSEYYWNLLLNIDSQSEVLLAYVEFYDRIISAAIFMTWANTYIHYHLGGSVSEYLYTRANNFLFWNVEKWALESGFKFMHLGGGVKADDGLERFKKGISNTSFDFYIGKNVLNPEIFALLNRKAMKIGKETYDESFFPSYRSVLRHKNCFELLKGGNK